jgi:hypothetical protein
MIVKCIVTDDKEQAKKDHMACDEEAQMNDTKKL